MTDIPLFPLKTVLFPGGLLQLRIFETRYVDMVRNSMRDGNPGFVVVAIRSGSETARDSCIHAVGTRAEIIDWENRPDGLLGILAQGRERVRIHDVSIQPDGLNVGRTVMLGELPSIMVPEEHLELSQFLRRIVKHLGEPWSRLQHRYDDCAWVAGRLGELLPLGLEIRQAMLEQEDPLQRLRILQAALVAEGDH